ncbi:hypothetical protein BS47DRAFT_1357887 [Hydnum rufescens UP504]|uniref:CSC1/OSCA1-like 7TM region domain-containing protein n=1 Tax=Hydnum rufescens UP504 TaxID=1448309 RepID=A0A9P6B9P9_9AGAM|nr:hypothetical protein BS47DRAFT_1357887 [Hydnum rufescens UP504]
MSISTSRVSNQPSLSQDRTSYYSVTLSVAVTTSATVPATITRGSTVLRTSIATSSLLQVPTTSYSLQTARPTIVLSYDTRSICAGDGLDSMSIGVLSTIVFSVVVGAFIWVTFAILRPRIPQIASLRHTLPNAQYGGQYSALHDLSVIRLLRLLHRGSVTPDEGVLQRRLLVDGVDESHKARLRLLVLSIMVIVLVMAALLMLYREFNKLLSYRRLWLRVRCDDMEIGWLSLDQTPGLTGLGEEAVKDVFAGNGLVSARRGRNSVGSNESRRRRSTALARQGPQHDEHSESDDANNSSYTDGNDIDVTGVFSVVDTRDAETLIHTRDRVLNSLELAEAHYINTYCRCFPGSGPLLPIVRKQSQHHHQYLKALYGRIKSWREQLKTLNTEVDMEQQRMYFNIRNGISVRGWLLVGRGVRFLPGIRMIPGRSKDDIRWAELQNNGGNIGRMYFWVMVTLLSLLLAILLTGLVCLALGSAPNFAHYLPALKSLVRYDDLGPAIGTTLVPSLLTMLFIATLLGFIHYFSRFSGSVSHSDNRTMELKAAFYAITLIGGAWLIGISAILFGLQAFSTGSDQATTVSEGVVYIAGFILALVISAFIVPGLLLLQPIRLWRIISAKRKALFINLTLLLALYPRTYNPSFGMGASILGLFFAAAFSMLFPLIGPPLVLLLFLTLMVHRYLVGYSPFRSLAAPLAHSAVCTLVTLQPFLLGLILLAHRLWALGSLLLCVAVFGLVAVELYAETQTREPDVDSLSLRAWESLDKFVSQVMTGEADLVPYPVQFVAEQQGTRSSMASMLEMIAASLAVGPSASLQSKPVPFPKETINDLVSTARAAAAFATLDSPPRLNPTDPEDDVADFLYPPELLAPAPPIWLYNDSAGIAQSRAHDLKREHDLDVFLDGPSPSLKGSRRRRRTPDRMNEE